MSKKESYNFVCLKVTKLSLPFRGPAIQSSARNSAECEKQTNLEMEDKLTKLLEMFPQRTRSELLEVIVFLFLTQFLEKDIFVGCYWCYLHLV